MAQSIDQRRRLLVLSAACSVAVLVSGCVTEALFKAERYDEEVSSVLISADGRQLVFIGKNYHYIFDVPEIVAKTLSANFRQSVSATFGTFNVDGQGVVKGKVSLHLSVKAPEEDKLSSIAMGYRKGVIANVGYYCEYEANLTGVRYKSSGIQPTQTSQKLNRTYSVSVVAEQSSGEKAAKALLTPITATVDGVLIIGSIPLLLVGVTVVATALTIACHDRPHCLK